MKKKRLFGAAAGVVCGILAGMSGLSGLVRAENEEPLKTVPEVEKTCQYNVASIGKTFTAVAVMKLCEEGKLELDRPVCAYLPDFKMQDERYKDITVRMLLNHTSGLMGSVYHDSVLFRSGETIVHDKLLVMLASESLKADPGSYLVYSNDAFSFAELLIEEVTGQSFSEYVEENITKPLHMENTVSAFELGKAIQKQQKEKLPVFQADGYLNGKMKVPFEYATEIGSGGMISSAEDLCRFADIFMENKAGVLSRDSVEEMLKDSYQDTTYLKVEGVEGKTVGLGFDALSSYAFEKENIRAIRKGGDLAFNHGDLTILPDQKMAAAVVSSGGSSTFDAMVSEAILMAELEENGIVEPGMEERAQLKNNKEELLGSTGESIPDTLREYEGTYAGNITVKVEFPNETQMKITNLDEKGQNFLFDFTKEGFFSAQGVIYADNKIEESNGGKTGVMRIYCCEEADGERYLYFSAYQQMTGLGMTEVHEVAGRKIREKTLSEEETKAWAERYDRKYYLYNEDYSSAEWLSGNQMLKLCDFGFPGYVRGEGTMGKNLEIVGKDESVCACIGRDMTRMAFAKKEEKEYLSALDDGSVFIREDAIGELPEKMEEYQLSEDENARWFVIPESMTGEEKEIRVEGEGSVHVYDEKDSCIFSTLLLNGNRRVVLPENGKVAIVGTDKAKFRFQ